MLESLGIDPVSAWVLHHHERWDGSGYPDGLPGDAIPLGARIIFVADAFDAMTSERVYRDRLDASDALAEPARARARSSTRTSSPPSPKSSASASRRPSSSRRPRRPAAVSAVCAETGHNRHTSDDANHPGRGVSSSAREAGEPPLGGGVAFGPWRVGTGPFEECGGSRGSLMTEPLTEQRSPGRRERGGVYARHKRVPRPRPRRDRGRGQEGQAELPGRRTEARRPPPGYRRASFLALRQRHVLPEECPRGRCVEPVSTFVERQYVSPVIVVAATMSVSVAPAPRKFGPPESP